MTNQELAAQDKRIVEAVPAMDLKFALRLVYDLAAENALGDDDASGGLEDEQFRQHVALEKVWAHILTLAD